MIEFTRRKSTQHHSNLPTYYLLFFACGENGFATDCTNFTD